MNRKYNIPEILRILDEIKRNSNTQLLNHIIFDYHDETIEELADTFKLLAYYDKNFYFKYSDITNTYGARWISENLRKKLTLLKKLQKKYNIDIAL